MSLIFARVLLQYDLPEDRHEDDVTINKILRFII